MESTYIISDKSIHNSISKSVIIRPQQADNKPMEIVVKRRVNGTPIERVDDYIIESNAINEIINLVNQRID